MGPTSSLHDSKLYMTRHLLHYSVDGYPLQIYATRISLIEGVDTGHSPNTLTLVIAHGVSMSMSSSIHCHVEPAQLNPFRCRDVLSDGRASV